ncbi:hypothetical protein Tco_1244472 [Tanacetum coccineum]
MSKTLVLRMLNDKKDLRNWRWSCDQGWKPAELLVKSLGSDRKRRAFWSLNEDILKINDSDNQYAVSIKEDTTYPCLQSPKTTKETSSIRRIQRNSIRRIQDIVCEYSGRYQTWSLLQETPNTPYPIPWIRRIEQTLDSINRKLKNNTFSGSDHEDANEHIEKVLEIINLFHIPNITIDQVMLRAFPMSLTGAASR